MIFSITFTFGMPLNQLLFFCFTRVILLIPVLYKIVIIVYNFDLKGRLRICIHGAKEFLRLIKVTAKNAVTRSAAEFTELLISYILYLDTAYYLFKHRAVIAKRQRKHAILAKRILAQQRKASENKELARRVTPRAEGSKKVQPSDRLSQKFDLKSIMDKERRRRKKPKKTK